MSLRSPGSHPSVAPDTISATKARGNRGASSSLHRDGVDGRDNRIRIPGSCSAARYLMVPLGQPTVCSRLRSSTDRAQIAGRPRSHLGCAPPRAPTCDSNYRRSARFLSRRTPKRGRRGQQNPQAGVAGSIPGVTNLRPEFPLVSEISTTALREGSSTLAGRELAGTTEPLTARTPAPGPAVPPHSVAVTHTPPRSSALPDERSICQMVATLRFAAESTDSSTVHPP